MMVVVVVVVLHVSLVVYSGAVYSCRCGGLLVVVVP